MNSDSIVNEIQMAAGMLSKLFINLELFLEEEKEKKEEGEEFDEYILKNANLAKMHASHCLGELIETKSCLTTELTPIDIICKKQYEDEMSQSIDAIIKKDKLDDIFNGD